MRLWGKWYDFETLLQNGIYDYQLSRVLNSDVLFVNHIYYGCQLSVMYTVISYPYLTKKLQENTVFLSARPTTVIWFNGKLPTATIVYLSRRLDLTTCTGVVSDCLCYTNGLCLHFSQSMKKNTADGFNFIIPMYSTGCLWSYYISDFRGGARRTNQMCYHHKVSTADYRNAFRVQ